MNTKLLPGFSRAKEPKRIHVIGITIIAVTPLVLTAVISIVADLEVTIICAALIPVVFLVTLWAADRIARQVHVQRKSKELQKTRDELEKKAKELEQIGKYKSIFLANMSHELRTPLNCIIILSELLAKDTNSRLTKKQQEFVKTIYDCGFDLMTLIDEILDLSKIEAGKMEIQRELLGLGSFIDTIQRVFTPVAAQKGLTFTVTATKDKLPEFIYTDPYRLRQIINNLLSNALKFTEKGEINLHVDKPGKKTDLSHDKFQSHNAVAFSVSDTGIGIPEHKHGEIFEAFKQEDGTTSRQYGGTGLGLSIAKELTELLGGKIQLESETGKGSTFTVYLPVKAWAPSAESQFKPPTKEEQPPCLERRKHKRKKAPDAKDRTQMEVPELKDKKVMIIDDDMRTAFAVSSMLEEKGMTVLIAADGKKGIEKLDQEKNVDLVLMDIEMHGMDGYETMRRIRKDGHLTGLPIIALTARAMEGDRDKCLEAGADDYLAKPVNTDALILLLIKWLKR
jgi:two-component system chemotaxis sensor kinase CheA